MEVRLIADGEAAACNDFHNRLYGHHRTLPQWQWEFAQNTYSGRPIPYTVAVDGSRIVGTQAFIPIRMIDSAGIFWTAKSEETLVDPEYRGQKLFEQMYQLLFDYARQHQFAYIWGFTPAVKAFQRLAFTIPGSTSQLFLPFSGRSISSLLAKSSAESKDSPSHAILASSIRVAGVAARLASSARLALSSGNAEPRIDIRVLDTADPQSGDLCRRFIDAYGGVTIHRDAQYLQWRLFDNPHVKSVVKGAYRDNTLLGWVAYTIADDGLGYLVDLMVAHDTTPADDEPIARALLREAVIGLRRMGATGIRGWRVNNHPFDQLIGRVARSLGFYHLNRGHSVVLYYGPSAEGRPAGNNFDSWFVTRIYTEGVLS